MEQHNKKIMLSIIGIAILVIGLVGITYAFFNYTRTGAVNNMGTGTISFSSNQDLSLNITNMFPMNSRDALTANIDTLSITISGDTTYADGEEFVVSIEDVENGEIKLPISFLATYEANEDADIGIESNDYWNARNSKNSNIYTLKSNGIVYDGKQVLVGYIKEGNTGIDGTLTIKAFIDSNRLAITDTYTTNKYQYVVNENMTNEELNGCASFVVNTWRYGSHMDSGTTGLTFCQGTGTNAGETFQENVSHGYFNASEREYMLSHNFILEPEYALGTTKEWIDDRKVITTQEWNNLQTNGISFKIRVESNEGIWVKDQTTIESCPDCFFTYTKSTYYATWNTSNKEPTQLSNAQLATNIFSKDYNEIVKKIERNYFLGLKLNNNNQITNAYVCGLKDSSTPFCVEGYLDGSKFSLNTTILQGEKLWNNTCTIDSSGSNRLLKCDGTPYIYVSESGGLGAGSDINDAINNCNVYYSGSIGCN